MTTTERDAIRNAVSLAVRYWPNAHLGAYSPREDIRSAFRLIRSAAPRLGLLPAIGEVEADAYRHMDM
jgi:hypothetical protein